MRYTVFNFLLFYACVLGRTNFSYGEPFPNDAFKVFEEQQHAKDEFNLNKEENLLMENGIEDLLKLIDLKKLIPLLKSDVLAGSTNSSCFQDLDYVIENINLEDTQNSWALKMLDAFGKPESGILNGNLKFLGDFDECRSVYAPKKKDSDAGDFHGKYCSLKLSMVFLPMPVTLGICLPDTCNPSDFKSNFNTSNLMPAFEQTEVGFNISSLTCKSNSLELSDGGIVTIFIISVFLLLVIMGSSITALKYFTNHQDSQNNTNLENADSSNITENTKTEASISQLAIAERSPSKFRAIVDKCDPFLNCFCLFTNGTKLLNTDATEGQLLCLNGIRFLSMTWVILCHIYVPNFDAIRSVKNVIPQVDTLPFQSVLNGWYSVDSFFVLSGFLMSYLYFQECAKRKGKTPWLYFYIHRYLRLTPVYMIVLAFYASVLPVMGSGPFWKNTNVDTNCHKNWWWNLLYINNFQKNVDQCFGLTWYLANDMQFFAISPLFLITLWRWPKIGYATLALFLCGSWLCGFVITYHYNLVAGTLGQVSLIETDPKFLKRFLDYMDKIYYKPYTRIAPYLIGIALGYVIFKRKVTNTKINGTTLWIGWLLSIAAGLYCVYGTFHQAPSLVAASFYNALSRTIYGLSLSWLIFVCLSGQGGVVDKILSYKLFIPLSRLTYCAYLLHVILMDLYSSSQRTTLDFNHRTMVMLFLGLLMVTYAFSMLVSLIFESPLIRLEKLIRNMFQSRSRAQ